jgi:hypothetical protein
LLCFSGRRWICFMFHICAEGSPHRYIFFHR